MRTKPDVPDREIERFMNFDDLMKQHRSMVTASRWHTAVRIVSAIAILAAIGLAIYWLLPDQPPVAKQYVAPSDTTAISSPDSSDASTSVQPTLPTPAGAEKNKIAKPQTKTLPQKEKRSNAVDATPEPVVAEPVYVQAEPVEGYENLYEYFNRELQYPQEAIRDSIQGVVTVQFVIDSEGKPVNIRITKSLGEVFDIETIRLIENMPGWTPATLNGKPVDSKLSLPFTFNIQTIKQQP
ncbi:MAG: energy transducer TonB [Bacteroidia bacterium]|nr:energy transducer TonB [Bacteroidia bacterium]